MRSSLRALLWACAAAAVMLAPLAAAAQVAAWPQTNSDIRPDPDARFGELANGMHYVLLHNALPEKVTAIRLRIGSGSLEESDDQQGLAHFLEHMAFKGSTHVPPGEMVKLLQRHGLAFGADTNAFTSYDQTVYQLDLPESDEETLDLGLMLMRETASELTLDAAAMEPERGVVLSEERVRDTPGYEAGRKIGAFLMKDLLVPKRAPIGQVEVLKHAPVSRLRAFYEANYRPERATLVVVGQFDIDVMETKIKARFSDWRGKGAPTAEPNLGVLRPRGLEAQVVVQPGTQTSVSVAWTRPFEALPDTRAKEASAYLDALALGVVNRRLAHLALADNPPFASAGVSRTDSVRSVRVANLIVTPKTDDWRSALIAADKARREAIEFGVQQAELDREVTLLRTRLRSLAATPQNRRSQGLAQQIVGDIEVGDVFTTPRENASIFDEAVKDVKVETLGARLKAIFAGAGPLITLITPTTYPAGDAGLIDAFRTAEAAPIAAPEAVAKVDWPYTDFGKPGVVVERHEVADLGITYVKFANGARLAFKPTDYRKNDVLVTIDLPGGLLALSPDRSSLTWANAVVGQGGFGKLSAEDMSQALTGRTYGLSVGQTDRNFTMSGRTTPGGLSLQMQVLTALLVDPGWRTAPLERLRNLIGQALERVDATPQSALGAELEYRLHAGDQRWRLVRKDELQATTIGDLRALWEPALSHGPIDVVMVGDIGVERAIDAVAKTIGALPARGPAPTPPPGAEVVHFPAPTPEPIRLTHKGRADQAIAYIAWPTTDYYANAQESRVISLTAQVLQGRLLEKVRIAEGATYTPSVGARLSNVFKGYGLISASVETPPQKIGGFFASVAEIARDLRNAPITADELERAKRPRLEQIKKSRQTNDYWASALPESEDHPERLDNVRNTISGYEAITAADIQAAARKYLRDEAAFKLEVTPDPSARAAPDPAPLPSSTP